MEWFVGDGCVSVFWMWVVGGDGNGGWLESLGDWIFFFNNFCVWWKCSMVSVFE